MKHPVAGVIAFAAFAASSSAQTVVTSFEAPENLSPWTGSATLSTALASDGSQSAEVAVSTARNPDGTGGGHWGTFLSVGAGEIFTQGLKDLNTPLTLIADVRTSGSAGTYAGVGLFVNYPDTWDSGIAGVSGATSNGWTTVSWEISAAHVTALSSSSLPWGALGFYLNAGIWDSAVQTATFQANIDNIRISGLPAIPEPSTYAAIFGMVGLAFAVVRRTRR